MSAAHQRHPGQRGVGAQVGGEGAAVHVAPAEALAAALVVDEVPGDAVGDGDEGQGGHRVSGGSGFVGELGLQVGELGGHGRHRCLLPGRDLAPGDPVDGARLRPGLRARPAVGQ
jgi:hypothetical protein